MRGWTSSGNELVIKHDWHVRRNEKSSIRAGVIVYEAVLTNLSLLDVLDYETDQPHL
jgi:hypothetical protein